MDNKFAVYAELIKAHQQKSDYSSRLIAARKGLSAVETLIFDRQALVRPGLSGELKPNEIEFNALSLGERRAARCLVLRSLLGDVAFYAEDVYQKWSFNGGRYPIRVLERMRAGQTPMVLNDLSNGIYYLEKVKDFKLGTPLGLNARCLKAKCPDDVEFLKSGQGLIALRENIASFSLAMVGGDQQPGFLTLVEERGRADLAQTLRARIGNMNQTLAELMLTRKSLRELVVDADKSRCADVASPNALCRLYFEVAETMKIYKSDFMTVMNLAMPEGETDND
ncbi:MAG TPA: imelysin family protein [Bdellovibrionales bacterium]|nr:imelysin family protein [Bdellovibrionales bacterium]